MSPAQFRRVAVIGAGPSGIAAARALCEEGNFDKIRVFERKAEVGGLWIYEPEPESFQPTTTAAEERLPLPDGLVPGQPSLVVPPAPRNRPGTIGAAYDGLDTNAGARTMAFTHTALPEANSAMSIRRCGPGNSTRPRHAVLTYLQELAKPVLHLISFSTHVEEMRKDEDGTWLLTIRREDTDADGSGHDLWSQELFDAVVVASGHFNVASVPYIDGLAATSSSLPSAFEHSKSFRAKENYANKKVVVVGGGISAADLMEDLHLVVKKPLYVSRRGDVGFLEGAWNLPNIEQKPTIQKISLDKNDGSSGVTLTFADGSILSGVDKVLFATGYRLSYPFLPFDAVTHQNRLAGFYQHVFRIGDPSLTVIGQVRAAISLRIYEYQAVAVARFLAGHAAGSLPTPEEQEAWERERLAYKGPTELFHEIKPDFAEYYGWLRDFAGSPTGGTGTYELPPYEENWIDSDIEVLVAKGKYWESLSKEVNENQK